MFRTGRPVSLAKESLLSLSGFGFSWNEDSKMRVFSGGIRLRVFGGGSLMVARPVDGRMLELGLALMFGIEAAVLRVCRGASTGGWIDWDWDWDWDWD